MYMYIRICTIHYIYACTVRVHTILLPSMLQYPTESSSLFSTLLPCFILLFSNHFFILSKSDHFSFVSVHTPCCCSGHRHQAPTSQLFHPFRDSRRDKMSRFNSCEKTQTDAIRISPLINHALPDGNEALPMILIKSPTNNISKLGHSRSEPSDRFIQEHLFQKNDPCG